MATNHTKLILTAIVLCAFFLRVFGIGQISLFGDEVSIAYNAYGILSEGKDEHNQSFPLFFRSFGEYKNPIYIYSSVPVIWLFGTTEFAVRFTSVLFGTLVIIAVFLLGNQLFDDQKVGLVAAALAAISPWHIMISRLGTEVVSFVFLFILGLYFLFRKNYIVSAILLGLSLYAYGVARLFVPLILVGYYYCYRPAIDKKTIIAACIFVLILLPLAYAYLYQGANERFKKVSVFGEENPIASFAQNYAKHISPFYLFVFGDGNFRHNPKYVGQIYLIILPVILFGVWLLYTKKHKHAQFFLLWFLLFAIPASLTEENIPHALRTTTALPLFELIGAYALVMLWNQKEAKYRTPILAIFSILLLASVVAFFYYLFILYPLHTQPNWIYGMKEVAQVALQSQGNYDKVIISDAIDVPYIYLLFYSKTLPSQRDELLGKFTFCPITTCFNPKENNLYIGYAQEFHFDTNITIKYFNGVLAYRAATTPEILAYQEKLKSCRRGCREGCQKQGLELKSATYEEKCQCVCAK